MTTTVFNENLFPQKLSAILLNSIPESSFPNLLSNNIVITFPLFSLEEVYLASFSLAKISFLFWKATCASNFPKNFMCENMALWFHRRLFGHFSKQTSFLFSASASHTCYEIPTSAFLCINNQERSRTDGTCRGTVKLFLNATFISMVKEYA